MTDFYSLKTLAPTFADVLSSNSQQWLFLTTRERLRQAINHEWVQLHDNQPEVIPQLRVMTLDGWVRELWKRRRRQHGGPAVLSNFAQRLLWRQIIEQWNREHRQVLSAAVLAELARAAYRYCLLFEVSVEDIQFGESEDTQAFQQWARQFQKATAAANGITLEMAALQLITELTKTPTQSQQPNSQKYYLQHIAPTRKIVQHLPLCFFRYTKVIFTNQLFSNNTCNTK
jgi:phage anti-repressor protein